MIAALVSIIVMLVALCWWLTSQVNWAFTTAERALLDQLTLARELLAARRELLRMKEERVAELTASLSPHPTPAGGGV